jgi:thiamine-monophosphate kinase
MPLGERAFTHMLARFFAPRRSVRVSIGDDAALVRNARAESLLCCDPVIEGVHFEPGTDLLLVGRKVVNRNLADIAAMGGVPDWLLVSLVLPKHLPAKQRMRLLRGIRAAARAGGAEVVGGDVAVTRGPLVVTVTAVGHCEGKVLRRSGARPGDAIHVSASLGGSRAQHHLRFVPPLAEGRWLARPGVPVTAAMDISDGLLLDLQTLLTASGGLGAEIDAASVPLSRAARTLAQGNTERALQHALRDGEDHCLLFTVARGRSLPSGGPLSAVARRAIGRVVRRPGLWLVHADGRRERVAAQGWEYELETDGTAAPAPAG